MEETQAVHGLGLATIQRSGELATTAMAAKAKAIVEARYVMAYNRPRNIDQARIDILAACKRPAFAEAARYKKPISGGTVDGFSIRFAEEAIKAMRNIAVESTTIYEDEDTRTCQISVTDLESNVTYGKDITISKTVERKALKAGQQPLSKRTNSSGQIVYLVEATEDDIANKVASAESKIIRNCGLRLVPSDILEEAEAAIETTLESGGMDVKSGIKKITDAFATLNVGPSELEKYLSHPLATVSPKELADLRKVYATIKDGQASWVDFIGDAAKPAKPDLDAKPEVAKDTSKKSAKHSIPPDEPKKTTPDESPQYMLTEFLIAAEVSVGDFLSFVSSNGRDRKHSFEATSVGTIAELPAAFCEEMLKDTACLSKLVKTFGPRKQP